MILILVLALAGLFVSGYFIYKNQEKTDAARMLQHEEILQAALEIGDSLKSVPSAALDIQTAASVDLPILAIQYLNASAVSNTIVTAKEQKLTESFLKKLKEKFLIEKAILNQDTYKRKVILFVMKEGEKIVLTLTDELHNPAVIQNPITQSTLPHAGEAISTINMIEMAFDSECADDCSMELVHSIRDLLNEAETAQINYKSMLRRDGTLSLGKFFKDGAKLVVKFIASPVNTFPTSAALDLSYNSAFVGQKKISLSNLLSKLPSAVTKGPFNMVVKGDPGMGKSSLVRLIGQTLKEEMEIYLLHGAEDIEQALLSINEEKALLIIEDAQQGSLKDLARLSQAMEGLKEGQLSFIVLYNKSEASPEILTYLETNISRPGRADILLECTKLQPAVAEALYNNIKGKDLIPVTGTSPSFTEEMTLAQVYSCFRKSGFTDEFVDGTK